MVHQCRLVHVPIPREHVVGTALTWLPFIERIAKRTRCSVVEHVAEIERGDVLLHLAWEPEEKQAYALAGTRIFLRAGKPFARIVWLWGRARQHWQPLLPVLEQYHCDTLGCVGMAIDAPPYWQRALESEGYRTTHHIMEKDF